MLCIFFELWTWLCSNAATQSREETGTDSSTRQSPSNEGLYQNLSSQKQHSFCSELQKSPHVLISRNIIPTFILWFQGMSDKSGQKCSFPGILNNDPSLQTSIYQVEICTHTLKKCLSDFIFQLSWTTYYAAFKYGYTARTPSVKARKQQKNMVWLEQVIEVADYIHGLKSQKLIQTCLPSRMFLCSLRTSHF